MFVMPISTVLCFLSYMALHFLWGLKNAFIKEINLCSLLFTTQEFFCFSYLFSCLFPLLLSPSNFLLGFPRDPLLVLSILSWTFLSFSFFLGAKLYMCFNHFDITVPPFHSFSISQSIRFLYLFSFLPIVPGIILSTFCSNIKSVLTSFCVSTIVL